MKTIIAGSREGVTWEDVVLAVQQSTFHITEVVSGTARGVDRLGERWAVVNHLPLTQFPADWDQHGKAAGHVRNNVMAHYADALIAVWDGKSTGTKNMIAQMKLFAKPYYVYTKAKAP